MYRLLIVDDEPAIVDGMKMLFSEYERYELDIYTAYSSSKALEIATQVSIDIILTDIQMPNMDGLQLSQQLVEINNNIKIIFLTGYNDFDYVYHAISRIGNQFILKSEGDDEIIKSVEKAILMMKNEKEQAIIRHKTAFEKRKTKSLIKRDAFLNIFESFQIDKGELEKYKINIDISEKLYFFIGNPVFKIKQDYMEKLETLFQIKFMIDDKMSEDFIVESFIYKEEKIIWLLQSFQQININDYFKRISEEYQSIINKSLKVQLSAVFITELIELKDLSTYYKSINRYFDSVVNLDVPIIMNYNDLKENDKDHADDIILRLERYIYNNLDKDLTLTVLADKVHFNPSYLSRFYKKETGENLSDFIINIRIKKAKELLLSSDNTITDIALALGFDSISYFCYVFKKNTKYTPTIFRSSKNINTM